MKIKLLAAALFLSVAALAQAPFSVIHNFSDNEEPEGSLIQSGNTFYGAGYYGGANGWGCIYSINKDGSNYKIIWNFNDTGLVALNANGAYPNSGLTLIGNKLYGSTQSGGYNGVGVLFSINTDGSGYRDLWDFEDTGSYAGHANGANPSGTLLVIRNRIYGVAFNGGLGGNGGPGMIYSIDTNGTGFKDMLDFALTTNGQYPQASLVLSGSKLFGTTKGGGCVSCPKVANYNYGNVFSIDTDGTHYKDVYVFAGPNGANPTTEITLSQNGKRLFGTTFDGGANYNRAYGTLYAVDTDGTNFKTLWNFNDSNGASNNNGLILSGSTLYGLSSNGGSLSYYRYGYGNVFSIDTNGSHFTTLHNFNLIDGQSPYNQTMLLNGDTLFGTAAEGGFDGDGVLFRCLDVVSPAGIQNITNDNTVTVYPNPTSGQFTIKSSVNGQWSVDVYNVMGQKVYTQSNIQNSTFSIDLNGQSNGVYMYRVLTQDGNTVNEGKLIIQK